MPSQLDRLWMASTPLSRNERRKERVCMKLKNLVPIKLAGLLLIGTSFKGSSFAYEIPAIIDFHVHHQVQDPYGSVKSEDALKNNLQISFDALTKDVLSQPWISTAVAISDTHYGTFSSDHVWDPDSFVKPRSAIAVINESTSNNLKSAPKSPKGLCGVTLDAAKYLDTVEHCLSLPGMIGLKLHFQGTNKYIAPELAGGSENITAFKKILGVMHRGVVLIHFNETQKQHAGGDNDESSQKIGDIREAMAFLTVLKNFPDLNFIIAHGGVGTAIGLNGLNLIANTIKQTSGMSRNVYVDTPGLFFPSYGANPETWQKNKEIMAAWRNLGMDRVLFGSDYPFPLHAFTYSGSLSIVQENPFLTPSEKDAIFHGNARSLLDSIAR